MGQSDGSDGSDLSDAWRVRRGGWERKEDGHMVALSGAPCLMMVMDHALAAEAGRGLG